jgi:hypothetical protein
MFDDYKQICCFNSNPYKSQIERYFTLFVPYMYYLLHYKLIINSVSGENNLFI